MNMPLLERLKEGEKFDFSTLAANVEQTDEFWDWWWGALQSEFQMQRPEIIADNDPILEPTVAAQTVNLSNYSEFFDKPFLSIIKEHSLPFKRTSREHYRQILIRVLFSGNSALLPGRPQAVFAGGGYGSGKTTALNKLAKLNAFPMGLGHLVGVDVFKQLIPEFNLIKGVADGRASFTVQQECQTMAAELFEALVDGKRSFIWDSSMSNKEETMDRVLRASRNGYELTMVAVLTPLEIAIRQAMRRARISRRFPHPNALPASHTGFQKAFDDYVPLFGKVMVLANDGVGPEGCYVVAEKTDATKQLEIYDQELFSRARSH